jgi:hypothetical protein
VYEQPYCLRGRAPQSPTIEADEGSDEKVLWYELLLCLRGYGAAYRPAAARPKNPDPPLFRWPQPWVKIDRPLTPTYRQASQAA